jgi:hypothetical protein
MKRNLKQSSIIVEKAIRAIKKRCGSRRERKERNKLINQVCEDHNISVIHVKMVAEDNQRTLFIVLMCLTVPGFINSIRHLIKKVHFRFYFRIDE